MRIVGGAWRGLALAPVGTGDAAAALRPTSDRVRESLFNILAHGVADDPVPGARVLDLFAGTGALGLEALSRGALAATFVDSGRVAQDLIRANIARAKAGDRATLLGRDATRPGPAPAAFDLVFLDPPYGRALGAAALSAAVAGGWLAPGALIVWETARPEPAPPFLDEIDRRRWGGTTMGFYRLRPV